MSAARGFVTGAIGLALLDNVLTHQGAADNVGGLIGATAGLVRAFVSPDVPALRDRSGCLDDTTGAAKAQSGSSKHKSGGGVLSVIGGAIKNGFGTVLGFAAKAG